MSIQKKDSVFCEQNWSNFTQTDHETWSLLFKRQTELLKGLVCDEVLSGIDKFNICESHIPKFSELNTILSKETGFSIVPVSDLVPDEIFFNLLAQRQFPSTCFIRRPDQLDYLEKPDIFHDVYGHVPLLLDPMFANFMEKFGQKAVEANKKGLLKFAARLYWFTVEFGLINKNNNLYIYGAGITSSKTESIYSLKSDIPVRIKFNLPRLFKTCYHTDSVQKTYFVINSFTDLFHSITHLDWDLIREDLENQIDVQQGIIINPEENFWDKEVSL